MSAAYPAFETLRVTALAPHVLGVELNRPNKLNAMNDAFWRELPECFGTVAQDPDARAVVLSGAGRAFSAGLDLSSGSPFEADAGEGVELDVARTALAIRRKAKAWQDAFNSIESCGKPVIACVHNAAFGAALEMISACDIRFCTADAFFVAAEVDVGLAADVGGLQRFPKTIGSQSLVRELFMSARRLEAEEALRHGLVSRLLADKDAMMREAVELACRIAAKSPVAMLGVKEFLNFSRDHSVEESLNYANAWNMSMLQGSDVRTAGASMAMKQTPVFPNLSGARPKL